MLQQLIQNNLHVFTTAAQTTQEMLTRWQTHNIATQHLESLQTIHDSRENALRTLQWLQTVINASEDVISIQRALGEDEKTYLTRLVSQPQIQTFITAAMLVVNNADLSPQEKKTQVQNLSAPPLTSFARLII